MNTNIQERFLYLHQCTFKIKEWIRIFSQYLRIFFDNFFQQVSFLQGVESVETLLHKASLADRRSNHKKDTSMFIENYTGMHCVKSVQIRSVFWSVFSRIWTEYGKILGISPYSVRMREYTNQKKLRIWRDFFSFPLHLKQYLHHLYLSLIQS